MDQQRAVFRPRSGLWLTVGVWALCVLDLVTLGVIGDWTGLVRAVPVVALFGTAAWVLFWRPAVVIEPDAVVLVNPARDIRIPWSAIVDVQPSFSLVVRTTRGRYRAWAAPGGTQLSGLPRFEANEQILMHTAVADDGRFAMSALVDDGRNGLTTAAAATEAIRRGWKLAQRDPAPAEGRVDVRWRTGWLTLVGVLLAATVAALVI